MARELRFVLLAMVLVWPSIYFLLPAAGYPLKQWVLLVVASVTALYAGVIVFLGETFIEDVVKIGIFLILTGILWYTEPRAGFVFVCALAAGVTGTLLNLVDRATRK
jgi:hypothetical protein